MAVVETRADALHAPFERLRIPARCTFCGSVHVFYYRWLRSAGGFQCPACGRASYLDMDELDAAMDGVDTAVEALKSAIGQLALNAWKPRPAAPPSPSSGA